MTENELKKIITIIRGEFNFDNFLTYDNQINLWFNTFIEMRLTYDDVRNGTIDYLRNNSVCPHLNDIVKYSTPFKNRRLAIEGEAERKAADLFNGTVRCPKCKDTGILYEYKEDRKDRNGNRIINYFTEEQFNKKHQYPEAQFCCEYVYPCECEAGRKRWPKDWEKRYGSGDGERDQYKEITKRNKDRKKRGEDKDEGDSM